MRIVRQFFTGLFNKGSKNKNLDKGNHIPKKSTEKKSKKAIKKAENFRKRIGLKALRNGNKRFATTKSFNDSSNDFRPDMPKHKKDPNAETYLKLRRKHDLKYQYAEDKKDFMSYEKWLNLKLKKAS